MLAFQGIGRVSGALKIIVVAAGTALPAGTQMHKGLAITSDGFLYVVMV